MDFESSATRIWKRLTPRERLAAATRLWEEPPQEVVPSVLAAVVKVLRVRPQVARKLPDASIARAVAATIDPGEALASSLVVALHLGERREMLRVFLDAVGLAHEDGILKDALWDEIIRWFRVRLDRRGLEGRQA